MSARPRDVFAAVPLALALATVLVSCGGPAPTTCPTLEPVATTAELRGVAASLKHRVDANCGFGGGVATIFQDGAPRWREAYGDRWAGGPAIEATDRFEIASVTKTFTATLALMLVDDGLLSLDAPITEVLSGEVAESVLVIDGVDRTHELTLRMLLGHTGGLPDYWYDPPMATPDLNLFGVDFVEDDQRVWEPEELVAYASSLTPIAAPGATYHYGDTGYVLAGLMVEAVTGQTYAEALRERIIEPLGLTDTFMVYREDDPDPGRPLSHRYEFGDYDLHGRVNQTADWAGGGLVSSAEDLATFVRALMRGELLDATTMTAMTTWRPVETDVGYGLGVLRLQLDGDLGTLWGHDGYGNAWMYYWPERDVAFTGTLNQSDNDWWPIVEASIIALE